MSFQHTTRKKIEDNGGTISKTHLNGKPVDVVEFDSLSRFAAFDYSGRDEGEWTYGPWREFQNVDAARTAVVNGACSEDVLQQYTELRESIDAEVQELVARMPSAKRERRRGIEGDEISIERVMVHDTDVWDRRVRGAKRQTVRIFINYGYHGGDNVQTFVDGVVRGVALADALQALGHTVEITACRFSRNGDARCEYAVLAPLKAAEQRLDPQQLLTLAAPFYQRVFMWGILEAFQHGVSGYIGNAQVTQAHVDHFGFDVFASGETLTAFVDPESPEGAQIAEAVDCIRFANWSR